MKLGIIGVGHLAEALLTGLMRPGAGGPGMAPERIILSPRGKGPALARACGCTLAADNAALVAGCDMVLLAVRPGDAAAALTGLPWRAGQTVLSACAGVPIAALESVAAPARIVRIMPILAGQFGASPTLVHPMMPALAPVLDAWGSTIALDHEAQFEAATTSAAIFGWVQALIASSADWTSTRGVPEAQARQLLAETFQAAAIMVRRTDRPIADLLASIATPGGITQAGLAHLQTRQVDIAWQEACDLVLNRLTR